jgi:hypothetical protein
MNSVVKTHQNNPGSEVLEKEPSFAGNKNTQPQPFQGDQSKTSWNRKDAHEKVSEANTNDIKRQDGEAGPLSKTELRKREELELKVKNSEIEGYKALAEIEHYEGGKLWKCEFSKFTEYAQSKFEFHKVHVKRCLKSGHFLLKVGSQDKELPTPTRESHIRPIVQTLPEDHQVMFWEKFCEQESLTQESIRGIKAEQIESEVKAYLAEIPKDQLPKTKKGRGNNGPTEKQSRKKAIRLFKELMATVENLPEYDDLKESLEVINAALIK